MNQGAGDQGMMFGYATNETENYMPLSLDLAHKLLMVLAEIRREGKVMTYLRPDARARLLLNTMITASRYALIRLWFLPSMTSL